jgi:hypothetical protein
MTGDKFVMILTNPLDNYRGYSRNDGQPIQVFANNRQLVWNSIYHDAIGRVTIVDFQLLGNYSN